MPEINFDAAAEPESEKKDFTPLPAGWYPAMVDKSALENNASGNGSHLSLTYKVLEGQYAGRLVFSNVTWTHFGSDDSDGYVKWGRRSFADLCVACGKASVQMTEELHNIPIRIKLKIKPAKGTYGPSNAVIDHAPPDINPFLDSPPSEAAAAADTAEQGWG